MSDIVERLNITADMISFGDKIRYGSDSQIMREAADEIEKLRAALKPFAAVVNDKTKSLDDDYYWPDCFRMGDLRVAAAALKETGND